MKTGLEMIIDEEIENARNKAWNACWNEAITLIPKVIKLRAQGMPIEDISQECNLPEEEVKKILE